MVMADQDDQYPWPALAPIRTSSNNYMEASCRIKHQNSTSRSSQKLLLEGLYSFQSPSSATSTMSLLHNSSSSSSKSTHLFSKCFIPIASSGSAISKVSISNDTLRRSGTASTASSAAAAALSHPVLLTHSSSAKSANQYNHGHGSFTMIPANVVGKKKPPGYVSDEPTSPEVTCIGRVRRSRNCKAWDALTSNEDDQSKLNKKKQRSITKTRRKMQLQDLVNPRIPRPLPQPCASPLSNGWRRWVNMFKDGFTLPNELSRSLRRADEFIIDRLCRSGGSSSGSVVGTSSAARAARRRQITADHVHDSAIFYINAASQSVDGDEDNNNNNANNDHNIDSSPSSDSESSSSSPSHLDHTHCNSALSETATTPPPPANCLLLGRSGSRSRVFHSFDGDYDADCDHDNMITSSQHDQHISPLTQHNIITTDHTQINAMKSFHIINSEDHQKRNVVKESEPKSGRIKASFSSLRNLLKR